MLSLVLTGLATVALLMLVLWAVHFPMKNAAIVDAGWAAGLGIIGLIYAYSGAGWQPPPACQARPKPS